MVTDEILLKWVFKELKTGCSWDLRQNVEGTAGWIVNELQAECSRFAGWALKGLQEGCLRDCRMDA